MTATTGDLFRAKRGVAALAACIVQALNDTDPSFQERFLERLARLHSKFQDDIEGDVKHELELFSWTRSLLKGLGPVQGKEKPLGST